MHSVPSPTAPATSREQIALRRITALTGDWDANRLGGVAVQRKRWQRIGEIAREALQPSAPEDASTKKLATIEQRIKRARTIMRAIWQAYDAAGHSLGRSRVAGLHELATELLGPLDPQESKLAAQDLMPLIKEAREWMAEIRDAETEEHFRQMFGREEECLGKLVSQMAEEITDGFEGRMR